MGTGGSADGLVSGLGVLDLQGGVQEHLDHLRRTGVAGRRVKAPEDLDGLAGLIIPGGETTCLARLITMFGLDEAVSREYKRGLKLWGTCAGAILLATDIVGESPYFGLIDISVKRNAFGSQLDSFMCEADIPGVDPAPIPLTFIRAPKITRAGSGVTALLRLNGYIAAAESDDVLVTTFHPELTPSLAFHRYFAKKCGLVVAGSRGEAAIDTTWSRKSWMRFAPIVTR